MQSRVAVGAAYGAARAFSYDKESAFDKGDRLKQKQILEDVLTLQFGSRALSVLELGCGTGYFTRAALDLHPCTTLVALDGSMHMLDRARQNLSQYGSRVTYVCEVFNAIKWDVLKAGFDAVVSVMSIHHLPDAQKGDLFSQIRRSLVPGGMFFLCDLFRMARADDQVLLERLACLDMQRKLKAQLRMDWVPPELAVDRLVEKDRALRQQEGDQEATLEFLEQELHRAGFTCVLPVLQDARIRAWACR